MKKWINQAINSEHRGILRKELGLNAKGKIPVKALEEAAEGKGVMAKRASLALTLRKLRSK